MTPNKIDQLADLSLSRTEEEEIVNQLRQITGDMIVHTLGISPELLVDPVPPKWSHPSHPQGEIVWYLMSGEDVYQVEKLLVPVLRGAGERTHRLWLNGNPMIGHQWCYSLEDAQWWASWAAERDLKMSEQSEELQLELELANLLWPDYHKTYNENGDYWYMNDLRIEGPNFKGYVPKWTRNNDACMRLMCEHRLWPTQLIGGIGFKLVDDDLISCEMYDEIPRPDWRTEEEHRLHVIRIAAVLAVIHVLKEKASSK